MVLEKIIYTLFWVYALGCGSSQSLMTFCGFVFSFLTLGLIVWEALVHKFQSDKLSIWQKRAVIIFVIWLLYSLLNLWLRPWDERTLKGSLRIILFGIPLLPFLVEFKTISWKRVVRSTAWGAGAGLVATLIFSLFQFVRGREVYGLMKNANYFAYNLLPAFVFWLSIKTRTPKPNAAAAFLGIALSGARMALLTALGYLGIFSFKFFPKKLWLVLVVLIPLTGFYLHSISPILQEKVSRTLSGNDPSLQWRLEAWKFNWNTFAKSPILGTGFEKNGIDVAKETELKGHWQEGLLIYAHSIYFQMLADSGILGTLLLLGYFLCLAKSTPSSMGLLLATGFAGITENTFNNSKALHPFLFYMALFALLAKLSRDFTKNRELSLKKQII